MKKKPSRLPADPPTSAGSRRRSRRRPPPPRSCNRACRGSRHEPRSGNTSPSARAEFSFRSRASSSSACTERPLLDSPPPSQQRRRCPPSDPRRHGSRQRSSLRRKTAIPCIRSSSTASAQHRHRTLSSHAQRAGEHPSLTSDRHNRPRRPEELPCRLRLGTRCHIL